MTTLIEAFQAFAGVEGSGMMVGMVMMNLQGTTNTYRHDKTCVCIYIYIHVICTYVYKYKVYDICT